jgi:two-component system sensor histidine kinase UhpB
MDRRWSGPTHSSRAHSGRAPSVPTVRLPTAEGDAMSLFWRLFTLNAAVYLLAIVALVLSPATVSTPVRWQEVVVLAGGLAMMLAATGLVLRASLAPLEALIALMDRVDLLQPGHRLPEVGNGSVRRLVASFNAMLDRLEAERGTSAARALAAQESERHRIAQELHDEIGQTLTAVVLELKRVADRAPAELRADLHGVQETARSSLDEVRQVARRLRPGVLEDLGLFAALGALATDFGQVTGAVVRRRLDPAVPFLPADLELVLYRITQEALTNVARHAAAEAVELTLDRTASHLVLRIADNGRGVNGAPEGAGLRGMRERALLVGAELVVADPPTGGTEIVLRVPLEPAILTSQPAEEPRA